VSLTPFSRATLQSACEDHLSDGGKVYAECGQRGPLSWEECLLPHRLNRCVKIGEGTFGEVFSTTNASEETVALKVVGVVGWVGVCVGVGLPKDCWEIRKYMIGVLCRKANMKKRKGSSYS